MKTAINSTGAGKRGNPTKSSVPLTHPSTQLRPRERSVAIQTLLLVRKAKSSSVKSKTAEALMSVIDVQAVWKRTECSVTPLIIFLLIENGQQRTQIVMHAPLKCQHDNIRHERNVA